MPIKGRPWMTPEDFTAADWLAYLIDAVRRIVGAEWDLPEKAFCGRRLRELATDNSNKYELALSLDWLACRWTELEGWTLAELLTPGLLYSRLRRRRWSPGYLRAAWFSRFVTNEVERAYYAYWLDQLESTHGLGLGLPGRQELLEEAQSRLALAERVIRERQTEPMFLYDWASYVQGEDNGAD